jgi:hypothetical protein
MDFSYYIKVTLFFSLVFLTIVAVINFIVDPGKIYHSLSSSSNIKDADKYIQQLVKSKYGLLLSEGRFNDRELKKLLVDYSVNYDCVVIGSSHVMQIGSARDNSSLVETCKKIVNLGVSGGTMEDYLALSNIVLRNDKYLPKTILFGIDPWSLNLARDKRWLEYEQEYLDMKNRLSTSNKVDVDSNTTLELFKNLFNFQYFKRSLQFIFSSFNAENTEIQTMGKFDQSLGADEVVMLRDGSIIYSREFIQNTIKQTNGFNNYKIIEDIWYQKHAVDIFVDLVQHLKQKGIKVILLMTPYHQKVWSVNKGRQPIVKAMVTVEKKVHEIAKSLGLTVIGSYHPEEVKCGKHQFFDGMHPKDNCLKNIDKIVVRY